MFFSRLLDLKDSYDDRIDLLSSSFNIPDMAVKTIEVSGEYVARPDLLCLDVYGDEMYTDIICKLNGLGNWFEMNEGMVIICPLTEYLEKFYHHPNKFWNEQPKRVPKKKPKKPSDATQVDKRFHIDEFSKTITY